MNVRPLVGALLAVGLLSTACASIARSHPAAPGATGGLVVSGALPRTGTLARDELAGLGTVEAHWLHQGSNHVFHGVPLDAVLEHMGFARGDMGPSVAKADKAAGWKKLVVATAADGFQALFSCAELMPSMGGTRAFVVWEVDGAPLPADQGPLRLIVTTDKEESRSPWALRSLEVVDVRDLTRKRR